MPGGYRSLDFVRVVGELARAARQEGLPIPGFRADPATALWQVRRWPGGATVSINRHASSLAEAVDLMICGTLDAADVLDGSDEWHGYYDRLQSAVAWVLADPT